MESEINNNEIEPITMLSAEIIVDDNSYENYEGEVEDGGEEE